MTFFALRQPIGPPTTFSLQASFQLILLPLPSPFTGVRPSCPFACSFILCSHFCTSNFVLASASEGPVLIHTIMSHIYWMLLYYLRSYLNFICVNQVLCHGFQDNCKEEPGMLLGKEKTTRNLSSYSKIMIIPFFTTCNFIKRLS